jgi:REP element-mobilizing transposase RayT
MAYDPAIHRRRSTRLPTWDYRDSGAYFVTVCTDERRLLFGSVVDDEMVLNEWGEVADEIWRAIPDHSPAGIDIFVVMPNHVHGIIWIQREPVVEARPTVGARHASPLPPESATTPGLRPCGALPDSISSIVGSFKSAVTKRVHELRRAPGAPVWQRGFHDRIIRDDRELNAARQYILDNPRNWAEDKHNPAVFNEQR